MAVVASPVAGPSAPAPRAGGAARTIWRWSTLRQHPRVAIGGGLVLLLALVALAAPLVAPYDPLAVEPAKALQSPSPEHWLGTDDLGRDTLSRVIWGSRISLAVGAISVGIGFTLGVGLGLLSGYLGGWVDLLAMRAMDALLAFPGLLLAIAITSALGPQIQNAMIAIGVVAIPVYARLARGQVLQAREREFVEAARALGARHLRIIGRHIFPNILNPLVVQATLSTAFAILAEASLSFLGLGAQPPTPTWGFDIHHARGYLTNNAWMAIGPGAGILLAVFSFNFLGDSLRDLLDPRLAQR